jgi:hypothetical protein
MSQYTRFALEGIQIEGGSVAAYTYINHPNLLIVGARELERALPPLDRPLAAPAVIQILYLAVTYRQHLPLRDLRQPFTGAVDDKLVHNLLALLELRERMQVSASEE